MTQNASKTPFRWDGVPASYPPPWQHVHIPWFKSSSFLQKRSTSQSDWGSRPTSGQKP